MSERWSLVGGNGSLSGIGGHGDRFLQPHGAMEGSCASGLAIVAFTEGSSGNESLKMSKRLSAVCERYVLVTPSHMYNSSVVCPLEDGITMRRVPIIESVLFPTPLRRFLVGISHLLAWLMFLRICGPVVHI